jgi:hypothetical protein
MNEKKIPPNEKFKLPGGDMGKIVFALLAMPREKRLRETCKSYRVNSVNSKVINLAIYLWVS